ncbi:MAG: DUF3857 domain-containing protein [Bacteroidia bacterium]|nr:DUF3857 domain-containing protein [Bacteroidia bacterium]
MSRQLRIQIILLYALLFIRGSFNAQGVEVQRLLSAYPNQSSLYLEKAEEAVIKVVKNKLTIVRNHHERFLILKSNYNYLRNKRVRTGAFVEVKDLHAYIHVYNGKKHRRREINTIKLASENAGDDSFYNSDKFYTIEFFDAKEGDIIEVNYKEEYLEPRFFGMFYLSDYSPSLSRKVSVTYPENLVKLTFKELNYQGVPIKRNSTAKKSSHTVSWQADSITPIIDETYDPNFSKKASYLLLNVESFQTPDSTVNIGGNLANLYSWYNNLIKNVDLSKDSHLEMLVDSLTKNETNDLAKLRKIFYWVQNKISYIAYEDGMNGYIPREASVVCKQRFGDCKDMANLIFNMSNLAGLPVYRTWIGTNDISFQFSEFPAPFAANHMIATYMSQKDTIFLDATGKDYPFGLPTSMIQGKEALIGLDSKNFVIKKVPFMSELVSNDHDSVIVSIIPGNKLQGKGYYYATGYKKLSILSGLKQNSYSQQKDYLRKVLEKGNNKFRLDSFYIEENSIERPLVIYYSFSISNYLTQYQNKTYANLNFHKDYFDQITTEQRKHEYHFAYRCVNKLTVRLNLQPGQELEVLPESISENNSLVGFNSAYKAENDYILFENSISIKEMNIGTDKFKDLEEIVSKYKRNKSTLVGVVTKP